MANLVKSTPAKPRTGTSLFNWAGPVGEPMGWLRNEIDRIFDDIGRPVRGAFSWPDRALAPVPALELTENDKGYRLSAELPGLSNEDIAISVADGVLSLSGEKKEEKVEERKGFHMSERRYGSFARQIPLPSDVDPDAISAEFKDGVLNITLGKDTKSEARTRKIDVKKA